MNLREHFYPHPDVRPAKPRNITKGELEQVFAEATDRASFLGHPEWKARIVDEIEKVWQVESVRLIRSHQVGQFVHLIQAWSPSFLCRHDEFLGEF